MNIEKVESAFGIVLHMHQPTIPASSNDMPTADLISNLQYMMAHQKEGGNHNAPVFLWCYSRISDFVRELRGQGKTPRVMLDYSGNLLWGLQQMGEDKGFNLDKASWTSDRSWVKGYEDVLDPMQQLSAAFHDRFDSHAVDSTDPVYKEALLYLLLSQTSCFRYWGSGIWTQYAKEICKRGMKLLGS